MISTWHDSRVCLSLDLNKEKKGKKIVVLLLLGREGKGLATLTKKNRLAKYVQFTSWSENPTANQMMCIAFSMCGENSESNQVPHIIFFEVAVFHFLKKASAFASVEA